MYNPHDDPEIAKDPGLLMIRDVYLAGPFFNEEQAARNALYASKLRAAAFRVFQPMVECRYTPGDPPIVAQRAYYLNSYHIKGCKFVLADLSTPDTGTAWELGYAQAKGIPILGVVNKPKFFMNLMLRQTVNNLILESELELCLATLQLDIGDRGRSIVKSIESLVHTTGLEGEQE